MHALWLLDTAFDAPAIGIVGVDRRTRVQVFRLEEHWTSKSDGYKARFGGSADAPGWFWSLFAADKHSLMSMADVFALGDWRADDPWVRLASLINFGERGLELFQRHANGLSKRALALARGAAMIGAENRGGRGFSRRHCTSIDQPARLAVTCLVVWRQGLSGETLPCATESEFSARRRRFPLDFDSRDGCRRSGRPVETAATRAVLSQADWNIAADRCDAGDGSLAGTPTRSRAATRNSTIGRRSPSCSSLAKVWARGKTRSGGSPVAHTDPNRIVARRSRG